MRETRGLHASFTRSGSVDVIFISYVSGVIWRDICRAQKLGVDILAFRCGGSKEGGPGTTRYDVTTVRSQSSSGQGLNTSPDC